MKYSNPLVPHATVACFPSLADPPVTHGFNQYSFFITHFKINTVRRPSVARLLNRSSSSIASGCLRETVSLSSHSGLSVLWTYLFKSEQQFSIGPSGSFLVPGKPLLVPVCTHTVSSHKQGRLCHYRTSSATLPSRGTRAYISSTLPVDSPSVEALGPITLQIEISISATASRYSLKSVVDTLDSNQDCRADLKHKNNRAKRERA